MKTYCPVCRTEMVERANILVCPRNEIGDCCYDSLSFTQDEDKYTHHNDLKTYVTSDVK
ncbi:hypothetical protein QTO01_05160 [Vibrio mytili]|uniref:hypothetical protein n=1 Tax=Vibrio mytili TaxID=50718 RepID=UPI0013E38449|nr:hypothetical protein [Vibrio mytili]